MPLSDKHAAYNEDQGWSSWHGAQAEAAWDGAGPAEVYYSPAGGGAPAAMTAGDQQQWEAAPQPQADQPVVAGGAPPGGWLQRSTLRETAFGT